LKNKELRMPAFARIIGIDYSAAETPTASLKGLRVYLADGDELPVEVPPPPSPRKYWTRKGIAEWLVERLTEDVPTLVGIDHGFSFPKRYFEVHGLLPDWPRFLKMISSATGRPTRITLMSSSSATASTATARRAWAMPAGGA
jgi:hypothetical protein